MTLQEFITQKQTELIDSGKYKDILFKSAVNVGLKKNCTNENFISTDSNRHKEGVEVVGFSVLPDVNVDDNGSMVKFDVLEKRKRKYTSKTFYFLYT